MRFRLGLLSVVFSIQFGAIRAQAAPTLTYQGRLLHADNSPVLGASVQFRIQIRTPGAENCLMYEERQAVNLSNTRGAFSLGINSGAGTRTDSSGLNFSQIFSNSSTFTFPAGTCASGTTYIPTATDGRVFQAFFDDGTTGGWEPIPAQTINYVPMSMESQRVAGFPASSLVRVANGSGPQSVSPITPADFTELLSLLNGTSTQYTRSTASGASLPSFAAAPGTPTAGQIWFNSTSRRLEFYDGTAVQPVGTVSSVDGSAITSGTIGGSTAINTSGNLVTTGLVQAGSFSGTSASFNTLRVYKTGNSNYVGILAPVALSTNYNLTLPLTAGMSGQVLATDGSGGLSWVANGTLTSVSSANSYLTVTNPTTTPTLTVNVGTAANTVAAGNDARITGALQTSAYNTQVAPAASCTTSQTPYWNSISGTWACQNIAGFVTAGTGFANGGNSFSVPAILGTNDANTLSLRTNGSNRITILTDGNVGIGTATPVTQLDVAGGIRVGTEATSCAAALAGTLRYNSSSVEFCNGSTWQAFGIAGTGVLSLNGQTANSQTFAVGASGLSPAFSSSGGVHTLNIPLASGAGVTSGTISKTDYDNFNAKIGPASVFSGDISGTASTTSVDRIRGTTVTITGLGSGNFLRHNGTAWVNTNLVAADIPAVDSAKIQDSTIVDADISTSAGITRSKLASGTADHVLINNGSGVMTSEAQLSVTRGGTGASSFAGNRIIASNGTGSAFQAFSCPLNQAITFDVSGNAQCSIVTGSTGYVNNGNSFGIEATLGTNDNQPLNFETNGTTKVTILANGSVGVGTVTPATRLDVSGGVRIGDESAVCAAGLAGTLRYRLGAIEFCDGSAWSQNFVNGGNSYASDANLGTNDNFGLNLETNNTARLSIRNSGNIGIGVGAPTARLHLPAGTATASSAPLKLNSGVSLTNPENGAVEFDGTNLFFTLGGNRRTVAFTNAGQNLTSVGNITGSGTITIAAGGSNTNVTLTPNGTGVTTTGSPVTITSNTATTSSTTGALRVTGGISTQAAFWAGTSMTSPFVNGGSAANGNLTIDSTSNATKGFVLLAPTGGRVGVGTTTPTVAFEVSGVIKTAGGITFADGSTMTTASAGGATGNTSTNDLSMSADTDVDGSGAMSFSVAGTERMRIVNGGNIAVGVVFPSARFHLPAGATTANSAPLKFSSGFNLTTPEAGAMEFDGTNLYFTPAAARRTVAFTDAGQNFTSVGNITGSGTITIAAGGSNTNVTLTPNGTGVTTTGSPVTITSNTATTSSTTGALRVTGGISTQAAFWAGTSMTSPFVNGGSTASGNISIESTSNATKGFVLLAPAGGNVGVGLAGGVTARLHLPAGSTSASHAPLKFTSGTLMSTPESGAMEFDGSNFWLTVGSTRSRISTTSGSGDFTGVSSITGSGALTISSGGSNTDITLSAVGTGRVTTGSPVVISNSTAATSSTTGALRVSGGISSENSIWSAGSVTSPSFLGGSSASGNITIDSTSNVTKGFVLLAPSGGDVGIGTATPGFRLDVQGGDINASGSVRSAGIALTSDIRFKKDIEEIQDPLEKILDLRGVTYNWRQDEFPERHFSNRPQLGVIAQEIEKQFPQAVDTNPDGYKSVNYPALIAPVIEAVKSLYRRLQGLESNQQTQTREIASLEKLKADRTEMEAQLKEKDRKIKELEQKLEKQERDMKARLDRIERALESK